MLVAMHAVTVDSFVSRFHLFGVLLSHFSYIIHIPLARLLVYIHAGYPNITSLTYNDQTRTLTCTSTGGPATTVTWRRDGVVITLSATYQQTKRLVDANTSTYQTVLTISPSSDIVGTYSCTVENDRGNSSGTVVIPGEI